MAKTGRKGGRNPYVHPNAGKRMLNQAGNDGYSFDERDDPEPESDLGSAHGDGRMPLDRRFEDLFRSSAAWQPPSGTKYLESGGKDLSGDWMNRPMRDAAGSRYCMPDTRHDLHDLGQFKAFMSMRVTQAEALSSDLAEYADLKFRTALPDGQERLLAKSFAERAVMALYGIDEGAHAGELVDYEGYCGELPYRGGRKTFERDLLSGDVNGVRILLDGFAGSWRRVESHEAEAAERTGYDFTREHNVGPVAEVHTMYGWTEGDGIRLFSTDMLDRYVAEVNARLSVHDALSGRKQDGPNMIIREAPDGDPCRAGEFEDNRAAFLKIMDFSSGKTPAGLYVFDGQSVVRAAKDVAEAEREAAKQAAVPGKTPARRDTRDLDAACGRIYGAGGPDLEPEP